MNRMLSQEDIQDAAMGCTYKKVMVIAVWRMKKKKKETLREVHIIHGLLLCGVEVLDSFRNPTPCSFSTRKG